VVQCGQFPNRTRDASPRQLPTRSIGTLGGQRRECASLCHGRSSKIGVQELSGLKRSIFVNSLRVDGPKSF